MKFLQFTHTLYIILLAGLFLATGCDGPSILPCENGDGSRISEVRAETGFDKVRLDLPGDVFISQGSTFGIEITAQENILDEIETEVLGSMLSISNSRCIRSYKTIRIDITMPEISALEVDGSGDIYVLDHFTGSSLDLYVKGSGSIDMLGDAQKVYVEVDGSGDISLDTQAEEIQTRIKGSGDVFITGVVDVHNIDMDGSGNLEAFDLLSDICDIRISGSGDADLNVATSLKVKIRGSGDVRYRGTPTVDADITGSGELQSVN